LRLPTKFLLGSSSHRISVLTAKESYGESIIYRLDFASVGKLCAIIAPNET
jgi:hypothetical protein